MKKYFLLTILLIVSLSLFYKEQDVEASNQDANGVLEVEDNGVSGLIDPEFPSNTVDPGKGVSTTGPLRIDYVSDLNFGLQKIDRSNPTYLSLAQQFHSNTGPRGYYIQISDYSSEHSEWNLSVTQNEQFKSPIVQNLNEQLLEGAVLSFDKGWANSNGTSSIPTVTRDTLAINEIGMAYNVASASGNSGKGIWTIEFGASSENQSKQTPTLAALTNKDGSKVMDKVYNKQAYSNSAVTLTIPKETKIYPVQYTTTLTWTLEASPQK